MATFDLGDLTSQSVSQTEFVSSFTDDFIDVYKFSTNTNSKIDLFLNNSSAALLDIQIALTLLSDSNGNGVADAEDEQLAIANRPDNGDQGVTYDGAAGTYFAVVEPDQFYDFGGKYDLDISASTLPGNIPTEPVGNPPVEKPPVEPPTNLPPSGKPVETPVDFAPTPESEPSSFIEIPALGNGNTLMLTVDEVGLSGLGELTVFSADTETGENKQQIASLSVLGGDKLPDEYTPAFTIDKGEISEGKFLQFELAQKGQKSVSATPKVLNDGKVSLDFDGGTKFSFSPTTQSEKTNLLLDDAATLDLSRQKNKPTTLSFEVYRDAAYNSTVGLYKTDTAEGAIVLDPILGTRVSPGEAGYKEAAIARRLDTMLTGENNQVKTFSTTVEDAQFLGTFLIANSADLMSEDIYFSHGAANKNSNDHVKMLGNNTFGFEDLPGLGDKDYNDFVVAFEIA
ncbi:MAG: DUF4114 domain-containing protein [Cyanobacteria bacterium J06634_5]